MNYVIAYIATMVVFFGIDIVWITKVARSVYFKNLGHLLARKMAFGPIALFYTMYIAGIVYFGIRPAMMTGEISTAFINGGLFGFFCYATYEFTNYATLKNWPVKVLIIDTIWGTVLTGTCAAAGYFVMSMFVGG